jgi:DNA-binding LacI/PurR family transcriptional regulator
MSDPSPARRRASIQDVARRAGVSVTTVSHTFTGNGTVATQTQRRVREAADALGYRPDALARGLRSSRLGVIALIERSLITMTPQEVFGIDYFLRFAGAAALAAVDQGYGLMFVPDPSGQDAPGVAYACDGFLVTEPTADDPLLARLDRHGIPYLSVGRDPHRDRPETVVDIATDLITDRVLTHVVAGGATRVGVVVGTDANAWNLDTETRYAAWAAEHGQQPLLARRPERSDTAGGREAVLELLERDPDVDAIYALTPEHSVGVQQVLNERGLLRRVQLVCGSDAESMRSATPPISAVDLQPEALAWEATMRLLTLVDGVDREPPPAPDHGRIIVRGTSRGPVPD